MSGKTYWSANVRVLIVVVSVVLIFVTAFDVIVERPEVNFYDKEQFGYINVTVRRLHRRSPYLIFWSCHLLHPMGNNASISLQLYEYSSGGRYLPTFANLHMKICDFFNKEPNIGMMLSKQFLPNMSCPFRPGFLIYPAVEVRLDKFPHMLPFSFPSQNIRARCDISWLATKSNRTLARVSIYMKFMLE